MRSWVPYIASLILALWLPATQHCGLEAAGLLSGDTAHADASACCADRAPCTQDGCNIVEDTLTKPAGDTFKIFAPATVVYLTLHHLPPEWREPSANEVFTPLQARPLDWVPSWRFVRRAAPLSRAPSLVG